jgi:hypothetical protein
MFELPERGRFHICILPLLRGANPRRVSRMRESNRRELESLPALRQKAEAIDGL